MTESDFQTCVEQHADGLFRFILKNLRHREDARDIVQNSFEILWRKRDEVTAAKSKSYLFTVGYHNMIDHLRKVRNISLSDEMAERGPLVPEHPAPDLSKKLESALAMLNGIQRSLILLKDYEGYSYVEIGTITGLNPSQVKVYLHRARLKMKELIGKKENLI
ncbi:MAG TPA: RNA polymerase sigma factor [Chitinophagaceae bacterium]|nr:RNA polymerase sigma factor [Chitinophagaceae bacterium]